MGESQQLVKNATDPSLDGPDWSINMNICDMINSAKVNDYSEADRAARCIHRRLQESDAKIIGLALTLAETCMKNCRSFAKVVDQSFMDEMVGVTRGTKGRDNGKEALRMIQEWAKGLPQKEGGHSAFHDTYKAMRARGVSFPETDELDAIFDIPLQTDVLRPRIDVEFTSKLERDLHEVFEKIKLCREMLAERGMGTAFAEGEGLDALSEVIGFLEACRDRMADLIEAGTLGMLSEDLLSQCFRINDSIFRTLEAEKHGYNISIDDEPGDQLNLEHSSTLKQAGVMYARSSSVSASPGMSEFGRTNGSYASSPYASPPPPGARLNTPSYAPSPGYYQPPPPPPPPPLPAAAYAPPPPQAPAHGGGMAGLFRGSRF